MRVRRVIATTVAGAGLVLGAASVAGAQSPIETVPPESVLPTSLVQETTTTTAAPPVSVQGNVLARTGQDIGVPVAIGGALAAGGAVLVLSARRRRVGA